MDIRGVGALVTGARTARVLANDHAPVDSISVRTIGQKRAQWPASTLPSGGSIDATCASDPKWARPRLQMSTAEGMLAPGQRSAA